MTETLITMEQGRLIAGRYRLVRPLGSGGSANVWAAEDVALGREVALKALTGSSAQGGQERERLRREARLLALLDHPRITTVYDFVEAQEPDSSRHPVLVTELITGVGLDVRLKQGPLPAQGALRVCAEVADALAAAHGAGIVHRDVKPANVILAADGAKLLDFGISRRAVDEDLTGPVLIGTPACMAPEQWRGECAQTASDIYALGCLLFWCLSGHAPFSDRELPALGLAHLLADPPDLPSFAGGSEAVAELYRACTRKDPADRPSALEAARVLSLDRPSDSVERTAAVVVTPPPRGDRSRLTGSVIGTAAVLALAAATALVLNGTGASGGRGTGSSLTSPSSSSHATSRTSGNVPRGISDAAAPTTPGGPLSAGSATATISGNASGPPATGTGTNGATAAPGRSATQVGPSNNASGAPGQTSTPSQTAGSGASDSPSAGASDGPSQAATPSGSAAAAAAR